MSSTALKTTGFHSDEVILTHICAVISKVSGNQFGPKQMAMVESRIKKRLYELKVTSIAEYEAYFFAHEKTETQQLVSLLTTHHTFFFREFGHFEYLEREFFDQIVPEIRARKDKTLRVWSAACSRGQEVYSLAMFLDYLIQKKAPDLKYEILGTDIDPESVKIAQNGVYRREEIKEIPLSYLKGHWIRGTGDISDFVKVKSSLKENTKFEVFNLVNPAEFSKAGRYDLIFCRNVFIYFTQAQIKSISETLMTKLSPNGLFFVGISESLNGMNLKVQSKGISIYAHSSTTISSASTVERGAPVLLKSSTVTAPILKVLCVDDSPSILTLLKAVFTKEAGFEIVGTAVNGKDAEKKVKELSPDLMTLDIHMPEMTGIEYLEKNYGPGHCPVVMITSVSRENSELAVKALELGASDYVEKPALNQLKERTDEIRMKVKTSFQNRGLEKATIGLEKSFLTSGVIERPGEKVRIIYGTLSDRARIGASLKELTANDPPTVILIEKSSQNVDSNAVVFSHAAGRKVEPTADAKGTLSPGKIYIADFDTLLPGLKAKFTAKGISFLIYGVPTLKACTEISEVTQSQLLIEEQKSSLRHPLSARASDQFPATSFMAVSKEWFTK